MNGTSHQFCVRWNSHLGSLGAAFPELLAGQYFVDVTLACEGHQLHCHRLVLASCSSYFNSLLRENPCRHPIVILPHDIKLWAIQALVDFMYKGEVNVSQTGLGELLKSAEILQIRGLCGSDANAIFNLNQVPNSNGTDMTMNNNETLQASSSPLNNDNGNGATSINEQNNPANNDVSQQYEALSAYLHRNNVSVTNSNNITQNSQRNSMPSTSGNQLSNTNNLKPTRIQRMAAKRSDSTNDELNLSSSQSEENNDNDSVSLNRIIEPKEEPLDENMGDDNMNADGDMNLDSESGRQDDNSDAGRVSIDYGEYLMRQEIVHHQNQTKQQQQEQNKRTQNLNKNNNKLQQKQNQNQLIKNDFHKIICRPQYRKNSPSPANDINAVADKIIKNLNIIKSRNTRRLNAKKKVSETDRNNVLSDKIKRPRLDYRKINDGNESDSSNASLIIIEKKQPIIEISDDDNEENGNGNNNLNNNNINKKITNKANNKKAKPNMADDDDVDIDNDYDDDNEILLRELSKKIAKGHRKHQNEKFNRGIRINTDDNKRTSTTVQRQLQQQQHDTILSFDDNYKSAFPSRSQSSNSSKSTETRNKTLSLKFDSQSMSISVMNPQIQETDLSNAYNSPVTNIASSTESKSVLPISAKEKASFRQEIKAYLQNSTISNHFDTIETENDNEIEVNDSNFENIVCAPNVNDFCSNDDNSGFILMSSNNHDNDNDINLENESLPTIYFDEEFYNLYRKPQPSPQQQQQLVTLNKNQYSFTPFSLNTNTNTKTPLKLNLSSSLDTSSEAVNAYDSLFLKENPPPEAVVLRNPRGNQPRSYSNEALYSALMDVKRGASIYRASQKHNVPRKTLRNWMKRWDIKSAYPMPTQLKQAAEKKKLKKQQNDEKIK